MRLFSNRSFRELPLGFPRVPLAVPYWNGDTYRAIFHSLSTGSIIDGADLSELRFSLRDALGVADVVLCSSGSFALELALRTCGVESADEVVVPTLCCTTVIPPILAVGALPVLADTGENLNVTAAAIDEVLSERTRAVIVPHLFGNPAEIAAITDLVRGRGVRVIDDAAQALGATIAGRPVGSFGDVGIFSFGCEKICAGLGGGAVISSQREICELISEIHLPAPQITDSLQSLLSTVLARRWRRWTMPLLTMLPDGKGNGPGAPPDQYRKERMANLKAAVAVTLVRRLGENINARRERVRAYQDFLGTERRLTLIPHEPGSACLTQVARVFPAHGDHDASTAVIDALARAGYEVQGSYVPIHLIDAYASYARKGLRNAERVWADLIELPCEPDLSFEDVERIAAIIKQTLKLRVPNSKSEIRSKFE